MHLRKSFCLTLVTVGILAPHAAAQAGYRDLRFPNTTGLGTSTLTARVHYPSTQSGANAPITPKPGGYPTVVFLHGFAALGQWYPLIGDAFARAGYVAVLSDTAQFFNTTQFQDGRALFPALRVASEGTGFLAGAIDMTRVGVLGHSMGGGNTLRILADNPGYACGVGLAPVSASDVAAKIRVPFAILHGEGDAVLAWRTNAQTTYDAATNYGGLKFFNRLDSSCNHTNVASILLATASDRAVSDRCLSLTIAFFDRFLKDDDAALEGAFGSAPRSDPRLVELQIGVRTPELWRSNTPVPGKSFELGLAGEQGIGALFAAASRSSLATPFGPLLLDPASLILVTTGLVPASKSLALQIALPNDATLVGKRFYLQGFGQSVDRSTTNGLRLSAIAVTALVAR